MLKAFLIIVVLLSVIGGLIAFGIYLMVEQDSFIIPSLYFIVLFSLMIAGMFFLLVGVRLENGEVYAKEFVPAHEVKRTRTNFISTGKNLIPMNSSRKVSKKEAYTIHVRALRAKGYIRQQILVNEEDYEKINIGEVISLEGYTLYMP